MYFFLKAEKQIELQLFKLYHNENFIKQFEEDLKHKQLEMAKIEKKKAKAEDILKDKKKEAGTFQRDMAKIEQDIREVVSNSKLLYSNFITLSSFNNYIFDL